MKTVLLAVVLAGACAPRTWRVVGAPSVEWEADALAVASCAGQVGRADPWGGTITVHGEPFPCLRWPGDAQLCAGINRSSSAVEVMSYPPPPAGALAHELGHAALCRPHGDCGEAAANAFATAVAACLVARSPSVP